jgi:transcription termination factor Rho
LTVIGTALIETGSRMDDIIFQEFKGTGNMELVLDRKLADRRIYPAMDIAQSGTRKEERILPPDILRKVHMLRRTLVDQSPQQAMESLVRKLGQFPSNEAFLSRIALPANA